jgi:hypothetical protein
MGHVLIEAIRVKVDVGQSGESGIQEKLFSILRDNSTFLSNRIRPLANSNIEMKLKILECRSLGIFSTDSNGCASFVVLSLFTLEKKGRMNENRKKEDVRGNKPACKTFQGQQQKRQEQRQ